MSLLALSCILGIDLIVEFGIIIDFVRKNSYLSRQPEKRFDFESAPVDAFVSVGDVSVAIAEINDILKKRGIKSRDTTATKVNALLDKTPEKYKEKLAPEKPKVKAKRTRLKPKQDKNRIGSYVL